MTPFFFFSFFLLLPKITIIYCTKDRILCIGVLEEWPSFSHRGTNGYRIWSHSRGKKNVRYGWHVSEEVRKNQKMKSKDLWWGIFMTNILEWPSFFHGRPALKWEGVRSISSYYYIELKKKILGAWSPQRIMCLPLDNSVLLQKSEKKCIYKRVSNLIFIPY